MFLYPMSTQEYPVQHVAPETSAQSLSPRSLIKKYGISDADTTILKEFEKKGFAIFMHGSGIRSERLDEASDIDFTIIGNRKHIPHEIIKNHIGIIDEKNEIDYISFFTNAENGTKLSYHLQNPHYRGTYPEKPFGLEYRSNKHKKSTENTSYIMSGVDKSNTIHIVEMTCPQKHSANGVLTYTPQVGIYKMSDTTAAPITHSEIQFPVTPIASIQPDGDTIDYTADLPEEVILFGIELNKMTEDTPLKTDMIAFQKKVFIENPIIRTLGAIEKYIHNDPITIYSSAVYAREELRMRRKQKNNSSHFFVEKVGNRLKHLYNNIV